MQRLGVIGTLVWDRIRHPSTGGAVVEQWGGITYSLSALSAVCPPGWIIDPLLKVGEDLAAPAYDFLSELPSVALARGFSRVPEPTNRVELIYHDLSHRGERLTGGVPSWEWHELEPHLDRLDALYLNFISGFEVELPTAQRLRESFPGPIYADLHSLFLGCPGAGVRQQRTLPRWREWVACFDGVQMNGAEFALLAGDTSGSHFVEEILELGPGLLVVTDGGSGARINARPGNVLTPVLERPLSEHVPVPVGPVAGDPTGCGDVWGSAFFIGLLDGADPMAAAERAHRLAASNIAAPGTDRLHHHLRTGLKPVHGG